MTRPDMRMTTLWRLSWHIDGKQHDAWIGQHAVAQTVPTDKDVSWPDVRFEPLGDVRYAP